VASFSLQEVGPQPMVDFILDNLAIGSAADAWSGAKAADALLCVAQEVELPPGYDACHQVPIVDMQPIPAAQLAEAVAWIDAQIETRRILVCCNAGVGRSSSCVIAFLCCRRGFGFGEAVEFVARRRPYISILPNLLLTIEAVKALPHDP
jgi:protein-tyrosine phosphatase